MPDEDETYAEVQSMLIESYLPELLNRIEAWATRHQPRLVAAIQMASEELESAQVELGYG